MTEKLLTDRFDKNFAEIKGKIAAAARSLSTTPRILTYKINQLGIDLAGFGK